MVKQDSSSHCVYKHLAPDGKYYIGITRNLLSRWAHKGLHYKNTKLFYPCIKEYGWDNIEHIVLHSNLTLSEAQELERKYIKEAKNAGVSLNQNNGGTPGSRKRKSTVWKLKEDSKWKFVPVKIYKDGHLIGNFSSLHQAARELKEPRKNLQRSIQNKKSTRRGYLVTTQECINPPKA